MTTTLQQVLENGSGLKLNININDNRSTMISIKWETSSRAKISLHRMFLNAPQHIMDSLTCYLRRETPFIHTDVKQFMENTLRKLDFSSKLDRLQLETRGQIYNLKHIYEKLNNEYFNNALNLSITWFGESVKRNQNRIHFGFYDQLLQLVKINRILDSTTYPTYFVSYVVYHEMLHHICPPCFDKNGKYKIHTKDFKAKEKDFRYYEAAQDWMKNNNTRFFL